jgi:phosphatidate cytidylyltransferase
MIWNIYLIILIYFLLGSIGFYFINRRKNAIDARHSWVKFITYFFIIHILFFAIVLNVMYFRLVAVVIIAVGAYELLMIFGKSGFSQKHFFLFSFLLFLIFSLGFYLFSGLVMENILYAFLVLSIFDSFSQITGQLWGKRKLFPEISPNKTVEGVVGGALVALLSSIFLKKITEASSLEAFLFAGGIVVFAFLGDLLASYYKRKYKVKDFSNLIPGHGGFLDRFDSLIAGGAFVAINQYLLHI